jgi:hypothetical protein
MFKKLFITFIVLTSTLFAQSITDISWGYSFKTPKGWKYNKDANGAVLAHDNIAGIIFVYPHSFSSNNELKLQMKQGIQEGMDYLSITSKLKKLSKNKFIAHYKGVWDGQEVKALGIGTLSPSKQGGAIIISIATPNVYSKKLSNTAKYIAKSISYPKQTSSNNLSKHFVGKWSTWSKYSESHIYLYPDGTYSFNESSSYGNSDSSVGATWGGASNSGGRGHWSVKGNLNRGKIITTDINGQKNTYNYYIHKENGTRYKNEYYINDTLYSKSPL